MKLTPEEVAAYYARPAEKPAVGYHAELAAETARRNREADNAAYSAACRRRDKERSNDSLEAPKSDWGSYNHW